jgi:hypothetical protein
MAGLALLRLGGLGHVVTLGIAPLAETEYSLGTIVNAKAAALADSFVNMHRHDISHSQLAD